MATDSHEYTIFLPLGEIFDFNGEDVEGWLSQIEDFFDRYQLDPLQRLAVIHNFMVGEATEWHYEMYLNWRLTTWESFVIDLRNRFSLSNLVNEDAIEVVVPEDSDDDAQILLVESAIEDMETAAVVVDKENDDDSISDLYHVLAVNESVVVGITTREVTSNMFVLNRCFLVLKDAEIREWSFKTQFHAINGALPPCLLTICEFDPVKLLSVFVSKLAFGGSWRFIQPLIHVASCRKPPAKPPDDLLKVMCERKLSSLLYWSTLEETVAETAGGGASQIELSRQLGAWARVLQGSSSIISFDAALSDFDFMMNEHKPSQKTIIIIGRFNVMVDGYCARSEIKKFMETVGRVRGLMAVLIPENTIDLITKDQVFSAYSKNQLGRLVHTYKGERHSTRDKTLLNMFTLYRIPPPPRGVPRIKDHFILDVNGEKHGRFFIHYGPQESMQLWNGILCDPLTPCVIICFEQFSDHGDSDFHSALHQKFAHTVNNLGNFAHQFMYLSYIDIGIQVKRRLLMEHFSLMRCDFHLEQRHCEADVVTIPILTFTLHGKPRNGNIGVQNDSRKGGGIDASGEKIAADTKKDGWALQGINVSKAFGEMIVVFEFVDGNCLNNFCPNLWLKKYGISQCLTTFGDHIDTASGYGKMFSAIFPTSITRARSMQPFPRFSMGIFVCIGVVQFFHLRSYVATPEPPTEAHDSEAFAKHELCYSYELFYAILIHALDMNEKLYEALLFSPRPTLTPLTYNAWIGACAGNDDLEKSLDVMSRMRRHGFQPDFVNFSSTIQSFTHANTVDSVVWQKLCSEIESDLVECNVHENKPHLELGVAGSITKHGFVVKMYVVNLIIKTLLQNGEISKATELFWRAGRNGLAVDVVSYDTIMMGFVKNGRVKSALDMFSLMVEKGREPTLLTYDSLIDGFCREGVMQDALTWLDRMRESGLKPDAVMYNALMKCLCDNQEVGGAMKLLSFMLKDLDGVEANMKAFRILIHGLCKEGCLKEAIVVHDQMLARGLSADLMSYTQLIDGFFKVGNIKKVMKFWKQMVDSGFVPDPITYSTTTVLFFKEDHLEYFEEIKEEYAEFYTSLSNACKEQRGMKHFSTKVVLSQVNMNGKEYVTAKEIKLSETVLLQLYFSLDELVSLMCFISKIFLFSLPRPPEMDGRRNEGVANLAFLMRFYNKIFMFSVPRPPEIIDLEDKVKFKGEGMLRIGILGKLRGQVVFCV